MIRRCLVTGLALLAMAATAAPSWTCGFEDPKGAAAQRVMLSLVYPNALYVQGAVDSALRAGVLRPEHFIKPRDFFALNRTTRNLRKLADRLDGLAPPDLPAFSMVLMGPVLWTRFDSNAGVFTAEPHVDGPLPNGVVVVTDVPALAALVKGDISGEYANAEGLVRFYGDPVEIENLRGALVKAFPGGPDQVGLAPRQSATETK